MKILMHCIYFPPEVGGLESHVSWLCRALAARGHDVTVVTSRSLPGVPEREVVDGVEVWRTWFPARNPAGWIAHGLASVPRLRERARDADVIHAQAFASVIPALLARGAGRRPERPRGPAVVATWHTSHFLKRAPTRRWRPLFRWMIRSVDRNLAASQEIAGVAEALAPGVEVEAVTNGVETDIFRPVEPLLAPAPGPRIVVPRRLYEKNGVEYLVRAVPAVARAVEGLDVVLVGDGPERERLERLVRELGVGDTVRFLGAHPHEEMPGLLSSADLAVFPSLMEATSVAALECMACGIPVAASRVGGLPEIVDDTVGGLFEPGDPDDLARVVVRLLREGELEALGRNARERVVERWSNARLAERHLEIYRGLLEGPRERSSRREEGEPHGRRA